MKPNFKNKEKGITLIALIITIIILLIIAGVTISIVLNDGLIEKSQNAVDKYSYEQQREEEMLSELEKYFKDNRIPISTAEQLKKVGSGETIKISENEEYTFNIDADYVLMNDIKLNEGKYSVKTDGEITFNEDAEQWTPIGTEENPFIGNFNGNGHTISGLYINSTSDNQGLFGVMESGTIENLTISGKIIGRNGVGGIVGFINGTGNVNEDGNVSIKNCYNLCNVEGMYRVGGVVGYNENTNTIISKCHNKGNIKGRATNDTRVGGICGDFRLNAKMTHCYNEGIIEGGYGTGGLVGHYVGSSSYSINDKSIIEYCYNIGNVIATNQCVGGIVGWFQGGIITECYNTGNINSISCYVGGIYGESSGSNIGTVDLCYNTGNIEGSYYVGGIAGGVGYINAKINVRNSYNIGNVKITDINKKSIGGIAGILNNGNIENCYSIGKVNIIDEYTLGSGILGTKSTDSSVASNDKIVSNCYYLTGKALGGINGADETENAEVRTTDQMKVTSFVTTLNNGGDNWTIVSSKNEGYPILKWQK